MTSSGISRPVATPVTVVDLDERRPLRLPARGRMTHARLSRIAGATGAAVGIVRDLRVPGADGLTLATDVVTATSQRAPVVVVRTPYGRAGWAARASVIAAHGVHVVVQSCRGTFGSDGVFQPFRHERADGVALLRWLTDQPWADGRVHTYGSSYQGLTQYALVDALSAETGEVSGMVVEVSASHVHDAIVYPGGAFGLETAAIWKYSLRHQERATLGRLGALALAPSRVREACDVVPANDAMSTLLGSPDPDVDDWIAHPDGADPWWRASTFATDTSALPPAVLVAGWHDLFLQGQVNDFVRWRAAGLAVRLVVGPWTHQDATIGDVGLVELLRQLRDPAASTDGPAVRYQVQESGELRTAQQWPPPSRPLTLYPGPAESLLEEPRQGDVVWCYDPQHPTPTAGGRGLNAFTAGRRDQRAREQRDDVVVFTGEVLPFDLRVAGDVAVQLDLRSDAPCPDLHARLCDVGPDGTSSTVTDAFIRLRGAGEHRVELALAPTAYLFRAGHRVRLQLASGAHPLHLRGTGTAEPGPSATTFAVARYEVRLGAATTLTLPVLTD